MKVPKNKKTFLLISILQECILSCHFKSAINVFFWWWYLFKIIRCRRLDHRRVPSARRYGRNDHRAGWWPDNENPSRHWLPSRCCSPAKWLPASALHCKYFIKILIKNRESVNDPIQWLFSSLDPLSKSLLRKQNYKK